MIEFAGTFVDKFLEHAALFAQPHLRHGRRFQGIQHAKQVLALAEYDLRRAGSGALGGRLHQIRASHRYLTE